MQCNSGIVAFSFAQISNAMPVGTAPYQKPLKGISGSTSTTKTTKRGLKFSVPLFLIILPFVSHVFGVWGNRRTECR